MRADGGGVVREGGRQGEKRQKSAQAKEGQRKKWPSRFDRSPDDESNNNCSYSQHDHQDAHLLPGSHLGGKGATQTGVKFNHLKFFLVKSTEIKLIYSHSDSQLTHESYVIYIFFFLEGRTKLS